MNAALTFSWAERLGLPANYGDAVLAWLKACGFHVIGSVVGGVLVRRGFEEGYDAWTITDNGGELNVVRVNTPETLRSVPYVAWDLPVKAITLAGRIYQAMRGGPIEYDDSDAEWGLTELPR